MNDDLIHIRAKNLEPLKVGDKIFKSSYDWELTEKDLETASRELGETEERKKKCLRKLKEKLSNDLNVKYRQDDAYLLRYLRLRKYDVKKAYQNIKLFYQQRKMHPEFFTVPDNLKSVQDLNWNTFLPYTDEEGRIINLLNFNRWNPEERTLEEVVQVSMNTNDIISMNPKCQVNGVVCIYDLDGLSMRHVSVLFWDGRFRKLLNIVQNGYPWRVKKVIVLHTNRFVRYVYAMVRPLLQKKMADRCVLLGSDMTELHQHVHPFLLPKRLKGTLEEEECGVSQYILDNLPYIKYERSFIFG